MLWPRKRDRAVGIVIHEQRLLLIRRFKRGDTYYSLPGGGIDKGEEPADAAVREVFEETTIVVKPIRLLYHHEYKGRGEHFYFLCGYISGEPKLGNGDERLRHIKGINEYEPVWINLAELGNYHVLPRDAVRLIAKEHSKGFSNKVQKKQYNRNRL